MVTDRKSGVYSE